MVVYYNSPRSNARRDAQLSSVLCVLSRANVASADEPIAIKGHPPAFAIRRDHIHADTVSGSAVARW